MIPQIFVENWHQNVSWQTPAMIEQDLVISRALVCLYNSPKIQESLVFRGGTALNKLYIRPAARYSEDIDFVQKKPEPIGETINAIRYSLNDWLGEPKRKLTARGVKLIYQYEAINKLPSKLKIEINTSEHFHFLQHKQIPYAVDSKWFNGQCIIITYQLEELIATKLRALYQRRKGRDLFDVWFVFSRGLVDQNLVFDLFHKYCYSSGQLVTKDIFLQNIEQKRLSRDFKVDMNILLPFMIEWNFDEAFEYVQNVISENL